MTNVIRQFHGALACGMMTADARNRSRWHRGSVRDACFPRCYSTYLSLRYSSSHYKDSMSRRTCSHIVSSCKSSRRRLALKRHWNVLLLIGPQPYPVIYAIANPVRGLLGRKRSEEHLQSSNESKRKTQANKNDKEKGTRTTKYICQIKDRRRALDRESLA